MRLVVQYRRIAAILLGIWLGAGIFADFAVTRNFRQVEGFVADPGSVSASVEMNQVGRARERLILRRYVGELNNSIFESWEWAELALGSVLIAVLFFDRPSKLILASPVAMLVIVLVQRFYLTPEVAALGRKLADIPADAVAKSPLNTTFWTLHGIYSGVEILKLLVGFALGARLAIRPKADPNYFVKQFAGRQTRRPGEAA